MEGGEIYTVPIGLTVHCAWCSKKLEAGDECFIEEDSSYIYCLAHVPAPKPSVPEAKRAGIARSNGASGAEEKASAAL
jgi:hypothetical protein